jgi:uncharacterized protein (DUF488 family)
VNIPGNLQTISTIGHSTRTLEGFIELLKSKGVTMVIDIRTIPRSRHNPHFNIETLPESLRVAGIGYQHMPGLGGLRHPRANSPNQGWRNASFRGFADYMQTHEFEENVMALMKLAREETVALMCAEAVPWRCHRSLVADALAARGMRVEHILSATNIRPHKVTLWARVNGTQVTYPTSNERV